MSAQDLRDAAQQMAQSQRKMAALVEGQPLSLGNANMMAAQLKQQAEFLEKAVQQYDDEKGLE